MELIEIKYIWFRLKSLIDKFIIRKFMKLLNFQKFSVKIFWEYFLLLLGGTVGVKNVEVAEAPRRADR